MQVFREVMNLTPSLWDDLGPAYHQRLEKNYVTFTKYYPALVRDGRIPTVDELRGKRIVWSIGGESAVKGFWDNVKVTALAGLDITIFPCKHFPYVSIPEILAKHIEDGITKEF